MRPSVTWLKELTINVGKSKNVSKSMLATSNGGVIGFITKIYDHSTTISLLSNSSNDSYIASSVKGEDESQIFGIISSCFLLIILLKNQKEESGRCGNVCTTG